MSMMIREPIRVAVIFGPGRLIRPVWFEWRKRKHSITETCYMYGGYKGDARLIYFSVRDGQALYELTYNLKEQSWLLERVEGEPCV